MKMRTSQRISIAGFNARLLVSNARMSENCVCVCLCVCLRVCLCNALLYAPTACEKAILYYVHKSKYFDVQVPVSCLINHVY